MSKWLEERVQRAVVIYTLVAAFALIVIIAGVTGALGRSIPTETLTLLVSIVAAFIYVARGGGPSGKGEQE